MWKIYMMKQLSDSQEKGAIEEKELTDANPNAWQ